MPLLSLLLDIGIRSLTTLNLLLFLCYLVCLINCIGITNWLSLLICLLLLLCFYLYTILSNSNYFFLTQILFLHLQLTSCVFFTRTMRTSYVSLILCFDFFFVLYVFYTFVLHLYFVCLLRIYLLLIFIPSTCFTF